MVKIQCSDKQLRVTIPKDISILKGWKKGSELFFIIDEEKNVKLKDMEEMEK